MARIVRWEGEAVVDVARGEVEPVLVDCEASSKKRVTKISKGFEMSIKIEQLYIQLLTKQLQQNKKKTVNK